MVERDLYPEVEHTIAGYGGYWKKTTDMHFVKNGKVAQHTDVGAIKKAPKRGDVDFAAIFPVTGLGAIIEVKYKRHNFAFAEIREEQRDVLNKFGKLSWLWLFMGDRIAGKDFPRCAWLIPWAEWLKVEARFVNEGLQGMAYVLPKEKRHRDLCLSARDQLLEWELHYAAAGSWAVRFHHPFYKLILSGNLEVTNG